MEFWVYALINFVIFFAALIFNFQVRERGDINMLDEFDKYRKKDYNPADFVKNFYNPNDYQRDVNRGKHTTQSHQYVDIFADKMKGKQTSAPRRDLATQVAKKVAEQNPALEKAFRELQAEFQRKSSNR